MWIKISEEQLNLFDTLCAEYEGPQKQGVSDLRQSVAKYIASTQGEDDGVWVWRADELYGIEGEIEIDEDGAVSHSDEGAYVMAWVWVSNDDMDACTECGAIFGTSEYGPVGDGYDGLCPSCADKAEEKDDDDEVIVPGPKLEALLEEAASNDALTHWKGWADCIAKDYPDTTDDTVIGGVEHYSITFGMVKQTIALLEAAAQKP